MISSRDRFSADPEQAAERSDQQRGGVATGPTESESLASGSTMRSDVERPRRSDGVGSAPPLKGNADRMHAANAITAILIHCEAIKRRSASSGCSEAEIFSSLDHIVLNAHRIWREIDDQDPVANRASE